MSVVKPPKNDQYPRLNGLIAEAKQKSPFYRDLYRDTVTSGQLTPKDVPLIDHSKYWAAYHDSERSVMTSCQIDGVLMKTGGKVENFPKLIKCPGH
jgi:phenylacetate-CoA ligase